MLLFNVMIALKKKRLIQAGENLSVSKRNC